MYVNFQFGKSLLQTEITKLISNLEKQFVDIDEEKKTIPIFIKIVSIFDFLMDAKRLSAIVPGGTAQRAIFNCQSRKRAKIRLKI